MQDCFDSKGSENDGSDQWSEEQGAESKNSGKPSVRKQSSDERETSLQIEIMKIISVRKDDV